LTTVARQTTRDMFSMWSDASLLRNSGKAAFSTKSVPSQQQPMQQWVFSLWSVHGLYSRAVTVTVSYELVFGPSSSLQRRVAELQANGSCDIGRQAASEDTV
jgi:hypothetical protein